MVEKLIAVVDMRWWLWAAYILCATLGGLASSLISKKGKLDGPGWHDKNQGVYNLGHLSDIIAGIAAAMALLWIMTPQTLFQLLGIGTIGGYGGSSILQALLTRLVADTSEAEKEKLEAESALSQKQTEENEKAARDVHERMIKGYEVRKDKYDKFMEECSAKLDEKSRAELEKIFRKWFKVPSIEQADGIEEVEVKPW